MSIRIAMISEHASPLAFLGGVDASGQHLHVAELSTALARQGHEVRVYTRRDRVALPAEFPLADGVTVVHVPAGPPEPIGTDALLPYMKPFGHWLARTWADGWAPDVVHAHFWMSGLAALVARRRVLRPVVQTFHATGTAHRRPRGGRDGDRDGWDANPRASLERSLGRGVDRVIALSHDEVRELVGIGVPRERIAVVPSGVDGVRFAPLGPVAPRTPDRPRILSVGRLVERKGFADLIRALRRVPRAEAVIVGGPPEADLATDDEAARLRTLAAGCGVAHRTHLTGAVPREDMPRWYRSADVLVCSPRYEPLGRSALEAMACGVPVVASAVGGLVETVLDGQTGTLVPARDPAALGRALRDLLADPIRRLGYATAAVDRVRRDYSWDLAARRMTDLYRYAGDERAPAHPVAAEVGS